MRAATGSRPKAVARDRPRRMMTRVSRRMETRTLLGRDLELRNQAEAAARRAYAARRRGLDSARRVVLVWWLACHGDGGGDVRPATRRAVDAELAVEECEPVAEAEEAASVGLRAADAVVADVHVQRAVVG